MRYSAFTAVCAAPMALAGFLQADLAARGVVAPEVRSSRLAARDAPKAPAKGSDVKDSSNSNTIDITQSVNAEVIVIWVNEGAGATTSTVTQTKTVTENGVAAATAAAVTHQVMVGGAAGLVYTPDTIVAAIGDMVVFTFLQQNHTVTQSAFTSPCVKLADGMSSGFMPNPNNTISPAPQIAMQVTVSTPLWFYCQQVGHCGKGMTFSINPTAAKTQAMFQQMAIQQNGTGTASPILGGSAVSVASTATATTVSAAGATSTGSIVSGTGTDSTGGSCSCSCLCGVEAFPLAAQGLSNFGGMSGAIPMALLEK